MRNPALQGPGFSVSPEAIPGARVGRRRQARSLDVDVLRTAPLLLGVIVSWGRADLLEEGAHPGNDLYRRLHEVEPGTLQPAPRCVPDLVALVMLIHGDLRNEPRVHLR